MSRCRPLSLSIFFYIFLLFTLLNLFIFYHVITTFLQGGWVGSKTKSKKINLFWQLSSKTSDRKMSDSGINRRFGSQVACKVVFVITVG